MLPMPCNMLITEFHQNNWCQFQAGFLGRCKRGQSPLKTLRQVLINDDDFSGHATTEIYIIIAPNI